MAQDPNAEREAMLRAPFAHFASPAQLVDDPRFTLAEKHAMLMLWELDARRLDLATTEGMPGGNDTLLPDIEQAQARLAQETAPPQRT